MTKINLTDVTLLATEKLSELDLPTGFEERFLADMKDHLTQPNTNPTELKDWYDELEDMGIDAIAAFYELYGYLPYNVSALNDCFHTTADTAADFAKELFDTTPASGYGENYTEYCWECNEFDDDSWENLDWDSAASMLEDDSEYHFVEFNNQVYVFSVVK